MRKNIVKVLTEKIMRFIRKESPSGGTSKNVKKTANIHLQ